eukprot:CAMPEP_0172811748 /NCGR_PEP_ID=MMETSP1075-20121228/9610_1 /TAXON_ID=2916 /ORGANISM="Ceratium fusus, Strain PA161109" /LENGTH=65 /DNA_ID=CAMNT_0013651213 /DNA_START=699 /DNA_END=893 /DNA_ORIENTATION=-
MSIEAHAHHGRALCGVNYGAMLPDLIDLFVIEKVVLRLRDHHAVADHEADPAAEAVAIAAGPDAP